MISYSLLCCLAIPTWAAIGIQSFHCPLNCKCSGVDFAMCSGEELTSLPADLSPQLIELNLMSTSLNILHSKEFSRLSALKSLKLSKNGLKIIERQSFLGLSSLSKLILKERQLQFLQPGFMQGLVSLQVNYMFIL